MKLELNRGKTCEFKHAEQTLADFAVSVSKQYAEYYSACAEHAKAKCENCEQQLANDDYYIDTNRVVMCLECYKVEAILATMD